MKQLKTLEDTKLSTIRSWYSAIGTITDTDLLKDLLYVCLKKSDDGRISDKTRQELNTMAKGFKERILKIERSTINLIRELFVKGAAIKRHPEYNVLIDELILLCRYQIKILQMHEPQNNATLNELILMKTFFTRLKDSDAKHRLRDTYNVAMRKLKLLAGEQIDYLRFNLENDYVNYIDSRLNNGDITIGDKNFFMNKYYALQAQIYKK